jgi:hypothetical protein
MNKDYKKSNDVMYEIYINCVDDVDMIYDKFESSSESFATIGDKSAYFYMMDYINKKNKRLIKRSLHNVYQIGLSICLIGTTLFTRHHYHKYVTIKDIKLPSGTHKIFDFGIFMMILGCGLGILHTGYDLCIDVSSLVNLKYQEIRLWWQKYNQLRKMII